jgi:hypothetical protein
MKTGPTTQERSQPTSSDGNFDDVPIVPLVPYGSGFDEEVSGNESDGDELDGLLLR